MLAVPFSLVGAFWAIICALQLSVAVWLASSRSPPRCRDRVVMLLYLTSRCGLEKACALNHTGDFADAIYHGA